MMNVEAELDALEGALMAFERVRSLLAPKALTTLAASSRGLAVGSTVADRLAAVHAAGALRRSATGAARDLDTCGRRQGSVEALWSMLAAMQPGQVARFDTLVAAEQAIRADILAFEALFARAMGVARFVEEMVVEPVP